MAEIEGVVVATDGSAAAADAVKWAAITAARRDVELVLVSSYALPTGYGGYLSITVDFEAEEKRACESILNDANDIARTAAQRIGGLRTRTAALSTPVIPALLEFSDPSKIVVVGSRGRGKISGVMLGSVSAAVASHACGPVVIIHGGTGAQSAPVVVGVDGSELSDSVLHHAFEEASLRGTTLTVVHAWSDADLASAFSGVDRNRHLDWPSLQAGEAAALAECMSGWSEQYPEVATSRIVVRDHPADALAEAAQVAQLVVVGSRGRGGFTGMLLGSTSGELLHSVSCPLMIVHALSAGDRS